MPMPELTDEQLDEYARRLVQLRHTDPAELIDADLEALAAAHPDRCVRMAAAELLAARAELANLQETVRDAQRVSCADYEQLSLERDQAREERDEARARITELEAGRDRIAAKLLDHRAESTRDHSTGEYKNPIRQGYDRGLTDALAFLGIDAQEADRG